MEKDILIVEDNGLLSLFTATIVRNMGHTVAGQVQTGLQAVNAAFKHSPDLLIISTPLPGPLSAPQAVAHIRARSALPVLYVSTAPAALPRERAKGAAHTAFLAKPVAAGELQSAITHLIATFPYSYPRGVS